MTSVEELERRQDEAERRQDALYAAIRPKLDALEPVVRREARQGLIDSLSAEGKVVKDRKPAAKSTTIQVSVTGLVSACVAAYGAWQAGDMQTFAASVGAAVAAALAIWRRVAVGDLQ